MVEVTRVLSRQQTKVLSKRHTNQINKKNTKNIANKQNAIESWAAEAKIKNTPDKRGTEYGKIKNEI